MVVATAIAACFELCSGTVDPAPSGRPLADLQEPAKATPVKFNLFFEVNQVLSAEELKRKAIRIIQAKGYHPSESHRCVINLILQGQQTGCEVILQDVTKRIEHRVMFNHKGEATSVTR